MGFSARQFRDALALCPTGVAVVTARGDGGYNVGVTVNSFALVSGAHGVVSFNLCKLSKSLDDFLSAETFAVNLLSDAHSAVSANFARSRADKWAGAGCASGATATPVLADRMAVFECEKHGVHEAGDHVMILGRVLHFEVDRSASPLLFYRSGYRALGRMISEPPEDVLSTSGYGQPATLTAAADSCR